MTPESKVLKDCIAYLNAIGAKVIRNNTGRRGGVSYGQVGSSDIIACLKGGRFLAVECKAKGGKLSDDQERFLAEVSRLGGISCVAYRIDDVIDAIVKAF